MSHPAAAGLYVSPTASKTPLLVLGSGTFAYTLVDPFEDDPACPYRLAGFSQNLDPRASGALLEGLPILTLDELPPLAATHHAICLLGDCAAKRRFVEQVDALGFTFATLINPTGRFSKRATIGPGGYLGFGVVVTSHCTIGRHVAIMGQCLLGEGCTLGDYIYIGPGTQLAGRVTVGSGTYIGVGAVISDHVTIGRNAVIGAGSVVIRDVPDGATVAGNPARELRPGET